MQLDDTFPVKKGAHISFPAKTGDEPILYSGETTSATPALAPAPGVVSSSSRLHSRTAGDAKVEAKKFYAPAFVSSRSKLEIWMCMLEKAYAKWYGSYAAIEGGHVHTALCDFVPGSVGEIVSMKSEKVKAEYA